MMLAGRYHEVYAESFGVAKQKKKKRHQKKEPTFKARLTAASA
jgi:hypothetical protein